MYSSVVRVGQETEASGAKGATDVCQRQGVAIERSERRDGERRAERQRGSEE